MIEKQKKFSKSVRKANPLDTILKSFNRCAKTIKTQLILKTAKKLQELVDCDGDDEKIKKKEQLIAKMKQLKAVDHQKVGKVIAKEKFPTYFEEKNEIEETDIDSNDFKVMMSHKKVDECMAELQKKLTKNTSKTNENKQKKAHSSSQKQLRKPKMDNEANNTSNPELDHALQLKKSKLSHAGKIAKKKAVFMDSLNGETEGDGEQEMDPRERARLEKSIRNRMNRTKNRALREKEKQEQMAIYGPDAQQKQTEIRKEYVNSRRLAREKFANSLSGSSSSGGEKNNEDRAPRRDFHKKPIILPPPKLVVATKPIIENAKKDELEFMAKRGKEWKETGVHPSWAAKKMNQAPTILPSQGKKIVFDD